MAMAIEAHVDTAPVLARRGKAAKLGLGALFRWRPRKDQLGSRQPRSGQALFILG
jgi:hypothetical protein